MRSPTAGSGDKSRLAPGGDTRSRILEAAVERFGRDGFDAPLRAIATDAGVTAPAIMKHFGSKESLRDECDHHVIAIIGHYKTEAMASSDLGATFVTQMAMIEDFQPLVRYLMRSLVSGGAAARRLLETMRTEALQWMHDGVAAGNLKPSRDEEARVKLTFAMSIGWMVQASLASGKDLGELDADFWTREMNALMLPALELYTDGLLADSTLLDQYLLYLSDPPEAG